MAAASNCQRTAAVAAESETWSQPRWLVSLLGVLRFLIVLAASFLCSYLVLRNLVVVGDLGILIALTALAIFLFAGIAIHELGHAWAARAAGMTLVRCGFFPWQGMRFRSGWRWRRRPRPYMPAAFVMAWPQPDRALAPQMMLFNAGGILANLASALALALFGAWLPPAIAGFLFGFAVVHLELAVTNALPIQGAYPSDGMNLLNWLRPGFERHPAAISARVLGRSVAGTTADKLPEDELAAMAQGGVGLQALHGWIVMKAAQNRGEWQRAAELGDQLDAAIAGMPALAAAAHADFRWIVGLETAFSKCLVAGSADALRQIPLNANANWFSPHLWPRCQALIAAFDGDTAKRDSLLAESQRHAEDSVDRALGVSEALTREAVLAV